MFNKLGLKKRKSVLGEDYVNQAIGEAIKNGTEEFQRIITDFCWDKAWGRKALSDREKSLLCLGIMIARGHSFELKRHIYGGINNGLSKFEIFEVILFCIPYCGIPQTLDALNIFTNIFKLENHLIGSDV